MEGVSNEKKTETDPLLDYGHTGVTVVGPD
jgi:hypothetical protein